MPDDFKINSFENWVTCHQGCNVRKGVFVFETKTLLFYLQMAKKRLAKAQKIFEEFAIARKNDKLLSTIAVKIEKGHLSRAAVLAAIGNAPAAPDAQNDPWVIAFGANFLDPLPVDAPEQDPELSDWLLERLERDLAGTGALFRRLDDERTGETVSVRYAFWAFDFDRIQKEIEFCWDVLEVQKYSELFDQPADELLDRAVVTRYHEIVRDDSGDPVGISACPACGSTDLERWSVGDEKGAQYFARCLECGHSESS